MPRGFLRVYKLYSILKDHGTTVTQPRGGCPSEVSDQTKRALDRVEVIFAIEHFLFCQATRSSLVEDKASPREKELSLKTPVPTPRKKKVTVFFFCIFNTAEKKERSCGNSAVLFRFIYSFADLFICAHSFFNGLMTLP